MGLNYMADTAHVSASTFKMDRSDQIRFEWTSSTMLLKQLVCLSEPLDQLCLLDSEVDVKRGVPFCFVVLAFCVRCVLGSLPSVSIVFWDPCSQSEFLEVHQQARPKLA